LKSNNQKQEKHQLETQPETGKASTGNHESINQKLEKLQPETSKASKGNHKSINQDREH